MAADRSREVKSQADFDLSLPCGEQKRHDPPTMKTSIKSPIPSFLIALILALACIIGLLPGAQAVVPAPDGGYPGGNTAEGTNALFSLTTGVDNTAVGFDALFYNTTGYDNTATGFGALYNNTTGGNNTAVGRGALEINTTGSGNTANGNSALFFNSTGTQNTATGDGALEDNTNGTNNTATGESALVSNNTGTQNTATGAFALESNDANNNTATGFQALLHNNTGTQNTATGESALKSNTTANNNTADGFQALFHNTTGAGNTATGFHALLNNTNGSSNIAAGSSAGVNLTTGSNNIDIGSFGAVGESNTIRIGSAQVRTFIKGISGAVVSGAAVQVNAAGQLGVAPSSARFKDEIKPMDNASEAILALKPVAFRYKKEIDPTAIPQFGLVAEDVEKVNPDLIVRDKEGKPYSVRYDAVNAMLLNEFLKEHRNVEEQDCRLQQQEATIARQQKEFASKIALQQNQIELLTAGLQKVSAELEVSKAAPQTVVNNQ
jgi:hypothetical protein